MLLCSSLSSEAAVTHQRESRELRLFLPSCAVPVPVPRRAAAEGAGARCGEPRAVPPLVTAYSLHCLPPRTSISTCSPCPRAMASLLSGSSTTASSFPSGPTCSRKTTGTRRTGGSVSTSPGTATAPGSPVPAWPHAGPRAGTRVSPRWKGENHSGLCQGGNPVVPRFFSWLWEAASQSSPAPPWVPCASRLSSCLGSVGAVW